MNHEDLMDEIRAYVGSESAWHNVKSVTIERDGTVIVTCPRRNQFDMLRPYDEHKRFTRMRDEARERDRANLAKLGKA